jgi:hypothetical protein
MAYFGVSLASLNTAYKYNTNCLEAMKLQQDKHKPINPPMAQHTSLSKSSIICLVNIILKANNAKRMIIVRAG